MMSAKSHRDVDKNMPYKVSYSIYQRFGADKFKSHLSRWIAEFKHRLPNFTEQSDAQNLELVQLKHNLKLERELASIKSTFASLVAHEFATSLSTIGIKSDILQRYSSKLPAEKVANHLQHIDIQVSKLGELLDDLMLINRIQSVQNVLYPDPLDIKAFCEQVLNKISLDWDRREIVLTCPDDLNSLRLDSHLIYYMLTNLVGNAVKYSSSETKVLVHVEKQDHELIFTVTDAGIGIPLEEIDKIFLPLYRANNTGDVSGKGLGLTILKTCIEMYGGQIKVESILGEGSSFVVSLPYQNGDSTV